jgi:5-methylcytosine-specific restriction endonuclease McrA
MSTKKAQPSGNKLDAIVAEAQRNRAKREQGYREKALRMYPWVCGRCAREFTLATAHELTVHHRDHNHDNNPSDGSNWELLCLYCHDNEHSRFLQEADMTKPTAAGGKSPASSYKPFTELADLLKQKGNK